MKVKLLLYLLLILVLLGCSFFSQRTPSASDNPSSDHPSNEDAPAQDVSTEGWPLPDPTAGLASLKSYHQELTISFHGKNDAADYTWTDLYQRDVWKERSADFLTVKTSEMDLEPNETLTGQVGQASYSRLELGAPCRVNWSESEPKNETDAGSLLEPAQSLLSIEQATQAGAEIVNDISARHYVVNIDEKPKVTGDFWLAESGGYVVRYVLTVSGGEETFGEGLVGEEHFEYNLSLVNSTADVVYPEGCSAVLTDFPAMDRARNLHRLPNAVDYIVSAETSAISKFYQDKLVAQGWAFVAAHDKDPKNVTLVFVNKDKAQAASILLNVQDKGVWVSAILRPWESSSNQ